MEWYEAKRELQENGTPKMAIGYCHIAFDLGQRAMEMENARLRAEITELRNQILDTGPMLPKNGVTIRYAESEEQ